MKLVFVSYGSVVVLFFLGLRLLPGKLNWTCVFKLLVQQFSHIEVENHFKKVHLLLQMHLYLLGKILETQEGRLLTDIASSFDM